MLSGRAPFHARSRDDSAAAVMARIKGGEFSFHADAWNHVSAEAKYVTKGKSFDKYMKLASRQEHYDFCSNIVIFDNIFIYFCLKSI
jgi:hypothetical protein